MQQDTSGIHPERVLQVAVKAQTFASTVSTAVRGDYPKMDRRKALLILCMSMAGEHHNAIMLLLSTGSHTGSAMALIRPLVETMVRGLWAFHKATPEELSEIIEKSKDFPKFAPMIDALNDFYGYDVFSALKGKNWRTLNGLTHSGYEQLGRRIQAGGVVGTAYREEEMIEAISFPTATLCIFASKFCSALGRLEKKKDLADAYRNLFGTDGPGILQEIEV